MTTDVSCVVTIVIVGHERGVIGDAVFNKSVSSVVLSWYERSILVLIVSYWDFVVSGLQRHGSFVCRKMNKIRFRCIYRV